MSEAGFWHPYERGLASSWPALASVRVAGGKCERIGLKKSEAWAPATEPSKNVR